jgi:two-component system, LytTR family, response regulator
MNIIRAIVIDDEAPARRKICRFLKNETDIEVIGESAGGLHALEIIEREKPDLLFLDVQMPGMDGFEIVEALDLAAMPSIIFITAHDLYAVRAFEVHALDYLLKPFDIERFQKVLDRARTHHQQSLAANFEQLLVELRAGDRRPSRLLIQADERAFFLEINQIVWVASAKNYVNINAADGKIYRLRGTIEGLEKRLDPTEFARVNRSHIVNLNSIKELHSWFHGEYRIILTDGTEIMWSRRYFNQSSDAFIKRF